jgi:Domain of unknown function (DUF305)
MSSSSATGDWTRRPSCAASTRARSASAVHGRRRARGYPGAVLGRQDRGRGRLAAGGAPLPGSQAVPDRHTVLDRVWDVRMATASRVLTQRRLTPSPLPSRPTRVAGTVTSACAAFSAGWAPIVGEDARSSARLVRELAAWSAGGGRPLMVQDHQSAISLAPASPTITNNAHVSKLAQSIIDGQTAEIVALTRSTAEPSPAHPGSAASAAKRHAFPLGDSRPRPVSRLRATTECAVRWSGRGRHRAQGRLGPVARQRRVLLQAAAAGFRPGPGPRSPLQNEHVHDGADRNAWTVISSVPSPSAHKVIDDSRISGGHAPNSLTPSNPAGVSICTLSTPGPV